MIGMLGITASLFGCHDGLFEGGETFYLENDGSTMPIWVTGNLASRVFIITNHGGPGFGSGLQFHETAGFQALEPDYAFVYWDQRLSGNSKGNPELETLTVDQHVEDLDKLITLVQDRYEIDALFLLGHSWGGGLSLEYLGRDDNQRPFDGLLYVDGSIEDLFEHQVRRDWILPRAAAEFEATGDERWLEPEAWYAANPQPDEGDLEPYQYIRWLGGYVFDPDDAASRNPQPALRDWSTPWSLGWNANQYVDTNWLAEYSFVASTRNITIPTLILWGREDGAVPVELSQHVFDLMPAQTEKTLVQLDECAHSPHYEKPERFASEVRSFIEANR